MMVGFDRIVHVRTQVSKVMTTLHAIFLWCQRVQHIAA